MRRLRVRSTYKVQSFGGWGGLLGGKAGSKLGSRLGKLFGKRFGKKFGKKMANKYLPGLFWKLGGALFPGLPLFYVKKRK